MDLIELREVFRKRMQEEDFCIGEGQVEKLFRELLGEPEPVIEYHLDPNTPRASNLHAQDILRLEVDNFKDKVKGMFERDDTFFKHIK